MESITLTGDGRTTADAVSVIVPSSLPACASEVRLRPELTRDARSQGGVRVDQVAGTWRFEGRFGTTTMSAQPADLVADLEIVADHQDPNSTYNFTTRQGPPTCSPPV